MLGQGVSRRREGGTVSGSLTGFPADRQGQVWLKGGRTAGPPTPSPQQTSLLCPPGLVLVISSPSLSMYPCGSEACPRWQMSWRMSPCVWKSSGLGSCPCHSRRPWTSPFPSLMKWAGRTGWFPTCLPHIQPVSRCVTQCVIVLECVTPMSLVTSVSHPERC